MPYVVNMKDLPKPRAVTGDAEAVHARMVSFIFASLGVSAAAWALIFGQPTLNNTLLLLISP